MTLESPHRFGRCQFQNCDEGAAHRRTANRVQMCPVHRAYDAAIARGIPADQLRFTPEGHLLMPDSGEGYERRVLTNGKNISEHSYQMSRHLGRELFPGESVHHRNGVRDDNRITNLELWTKPPRPGIRAADALAWAREIIARYEADEQELSAPICGLETAGGSQEPTEQAESQGRDSSASAAGSSA